MSKVGPDRWAGSVSRFLWTCIAVGVVMALASWLVAAGTVVGTAAASRSNPPLAIPPSGAFFGAFADAAGDGESPLSFSALESASGRGLDMDRVARAVGHAQPSSQAAWDVDRAVIPVVSVDTLTTASATVSWTAIAAGHYDTTIAAQARGLASLPGPVVLSFDHEPISGQGDGRHFRGRLPPLRLGGNGRRGK